MFCGSPRGRVTASRQNASLSVHVRRWKPTHRAFRKRPRGRARNRASGPAPFREAAMGIATGGAVEGAKILPARSRKYRKPLGVAVIVPSKRPRQTTTFPTQYLSQARIHTRGARGRRRREGGKGLSSPLPPEPGRSLFFLRRPFGEVGL